MTAFSFQTVPSLKFGEPAAEALAAMLGNFGARRLMIVTDPGVARAGLVDHQSSAMISNETAHLHKLGDKAVGLCRTPKLALFVFKLPDGQLLKQVRLRIGYLIIR